MFVELHAHSAYSFLDGASLPEDLAAQAAELGYEAVALTDHDGVYGSLEFAHAAKAFGVQPITGTEVSLMDGSHVTLLVETASGYANLCRLLTAAHASTRLKEGAEPKFGDTRIQAKPGVLLTMSSQYGANTLEVTKALETALEASSMVGKGASAVRTASGTWVRRTITFVTTPSVPSEPTNRPVRS